MLFLLYAHTGTLTEAKQLSALQSLLSLTSGPEAGFLGSSWVIILRAISALDALKVGTHSSVGLGISAALSYLLCLQLTAKRCRRSAACTEANEGSDMLLHPVCRRLLKGRKRGTRTACNQGAAVSSALGSGCASAVVCAMV